MMKREVLTKTITDITPEGIDQKLKEEKKKLKIIATQTHCFPNSTSMTGITFVYILFYEEWFGD